MATCRFHLFSSPKKPVRATSPGRTTVLPAEPLPRGDRWARAPTTTCVAAPFESRRWPCSDTQHQPAHHWRQALVPPVGVTCLHPCSAAEGYPRPASDPATPRCLPSDPCSGRVLPAAVPDKPIRCVAPGGIGATLPISQMQIALVAPP
jgi:hypothetical protein